MSEPKRISAIDLAAFIARALIASGLRTLEDALED